MLLLKRKDAISAVLLFRPPHAVRRSLQRLSFDERRLDVSRVDLT